MFDETDATARQSAVAEIRAFLDGPVFSEEGLPAFVNALSQRYRLDVSSARRLFVAEAKKRAASRTTGTALSGWYDREARPATQRPTVQHSNVPDFFDDDD